MIKNGYSRKGFFGNTLHSSSSYHSYTSTARGRTSSEEDYGDIQDIVDSFGDPVEAAAWLEDEGHDPGDFDL